MRLRLIRIRSGLLSSSCGGVHGRSATRLGYSDSLVAKTPRADAEPWWVVTNQSRLGFSGWEPGAKTECE